MEKEIFHLLGLENENKRKYFSLYKKQRFILRITLNDLIDVEFENHRFERNRRFKSYRDLFKNDLKSQKKKNLTYYIVCKPIFKFICRKFWDLVLRDIAKSGESLKIPTHYSDLLLGVDLVDSKEYCLQYGFKKHKFILKEEKKLFWLPYPDKYHYLVYVQKEYLDIARNNNTLSKDLHDDE